MRRIVKLFVIVTIIVVAFLAIAYFVPGVKSAVDSAVGPQVTGFFGSVVAGIEPVYTAFLAPWPNHAIFWGFIGLAFMYTLLWSWDAIRLRAKQSIDKKAGLYGTTDQPLSTVTHQETTKPPEKKKEPEPSGE